MLEAVAYALAVVGGLLAGFGVLMTQDGWEEIRPDSIPPDVQRCLWTGGLLVVVGTLVVAKAIELAI